MPESHPKFASKIRPIKRHRKKATKLEVVCTNYHIEKKQQIISSNAMYQLTDKTRSC